MKNIKDVLSNVSVLAITGHTRPDGDCVGACMALYLYIKKYFPEIQADIYLESPRAIFSYIKCFDEIKTEIDETKNYDLFISCDASSLDRLAVNMEYFKRAKKTVCIDHHVSNIGFADVNHVQGEVSSASEVLYSLLDPERLTRKLLWQFIQE